MTANTGVLPDVTTYTNLRKEQGVELLDTIDRLRSLGIDSDIPLPQIVVVGGQSSGKSSVLEAISGIPFPTNDGLCTRFPLEVVLRRSQRDGVNVHISCRAAGFSQDEKPRIDAFHDRIKAMSPITLIHVPQIVTMASEALGVDQGQAISNHVLHVEVSGPKQDHLTLIDLPGLFYVTKMEKDSASPRMVKELADGYMKQPRTIVLAVISAKSDYATQEILETLKATDPDGTRTIGVITGVDTVEQGSARETNYMSLATNDEMPLVRGWHVLRNPSFTERRDASFNRDENEARFFRDTTPWCMLPMSTRGAFTLGTKLSQHLLELIGGQMVHVIEALGSKIDECEKTLTKLGPERTSVQDKRVYLYEIGTKHQNFVKAALNGPYENPLFADRTTRLRAQIRARCDEFASNMRKTGHKWQVLDDCEYGASKFPNFANDKEAIDSGAPMFFDTQPKSISKASYLKKIDAMLTQYRTRELQGTFDPMLVGVLFRIQSYRWEHMARDFMANIIAMVTSFMHKAIQHLTDSRRARIVFARQIQPALKAREQSMEQRLGQLLKPYNKYHPITYSEHFEPIANGRSRPAKQEKEDDEFDISGGIQLDEAALDYPAAHKLMEHMQSYYNIAIRTFVDNVIILGVESCLLDELDTILSPLVMAHLDDAEVDQLASDSAEDSHLRRLTKTKLERLADGRAVCKQYEMVAPNDDHSQIDREKSSRIHWPSLEHVQMIVAEPKPGLVSKPALATLVAVQEKDDSAATSSASKTPKQAGARSSGAHARSASHSGQRFPVRVPSPAPLANDGVSRALSSATRSKSPSSDSPTIRSESASQRVVDQTATGSISPPERLIVAPIIAAAPGTARTFPSPAPTHVPPPTTPSLFGSSLTPTPQASKPSTSPFSWNSSTSVKPVSGGSLFDPVSSSPAMSNSTPFGAGLFGSSTSTASGTGAFGLSATIPTPPTSTSARVLFGPSSVAQGPTTSSPFGSGAFGNSTTSRPETPEPPNLFNNPSTNVTSFGSSFKPSKPCEAPPSHPFFAPVRVPVSGTQADELFQNITAMPHFSQYSLEEIRLADIKVGRGHLISEFPAVFGTREGRI